MWIDVSIVSGYFLKRTVDSEPSLNTVFVFRIYLLLKKKSDLFILFEKVTRRRGRFHPLFTPESVSIARAESPL